jgi:hypothetical protein
MAFYDEMQAVAREVMTEFQQGTVKYVQVVPGNGPVDNPGPPTKSPFTIPATATGVKFKYVQSGLAVATDLQVIAPVDARFTPEMTGQIEADGIPYKIVAVQPIPPVGTPVVNVIIFRAGG